MSNYSGAPVAAFTVKHELISWYKKPENAQYEHMSQIYIFRDGGVKAEEHNSWEYLKENTNG
jgi:hypothetical protein